MFLIDRIKIQYNEYGLLFKNGEFRDILKPGTYWFFDIFNRIEVYITNQRNPWINHTEIHELAKHELITDKATFIDLKDHERALVWVDHRFARVLDKGLYGLWNTKCHIRFETIDARSIKFTHERIETILTSTGALNFLEVHVIPEGQVGVCYANGKYLETLPSGKHVFWKGNGEVRIFPVETRELVLDIGGQEMMTQDKVTLRVNAVLTYRITDVEKSVKVAQNISQALYREAQLVLRSQIGSRNLDILLTEKVDVAENSRQTLVSKAKEYGVNILGLGIRDIILPGEMKTLLNRVIEAQKAAEANVIKRREETAATRSQLNTAKLMENNQILMRLRELEVLERISESSKLNVVLGEKGLADRVVNLL